MSNFSSDFGTDRYDPFEGDQIPSNSGDRARHRDSNRPSTPADENADSAGPGSLAGFGQPDCPPGPGDVDRELDPVDEQVDDSDPSVEEADDRSPFGESLFHPGSGLAIASLCVPPLTLLLLVTFRKVTALNFLSNWGWYLLGAMVLLSAALLAADTLVLRAARPLDWRVSTPLSVLGMVTLFWPITYPNQLFDRAKIIRPHLGPWAIGSVLCALFCLRYLPVRQLPACDSPTVLPLVEQAVRQAGLATGQFSVAGHRERSYHPEKQVRIGECTVRSAGATLVVQYSVGWFRELGDEIAVEAWSRELPACDDVEEIRVVTELLRSKPEYSGVTALTGWRQERFDEVEDRRWGRCIAQSPEGDLPVRFTVDWSNRVEGDRHVQLWSAIPPPCDSQVTRDLLRQVFQEAAAQPGVLDLQADMPFQFEHFQELEFDRRQFIRRGECTVRQGAESATLQFELEIMEHEQKPRVGLRILDIID